jgi:predicted PurR-regulated permease PerM
MSSVFDWLISRKRSLKVKRKGIKFSPAAKSITLIIAAFFIIFILWFSGQIIHPFIWAIITTYLFAPLIEFLESKSRINRWIWIILVYILIGFIFYFALSYAVPIANNEISEIIGSDQVSKQSFLGHIEKIGKGNILGFEINYKDLVSKLREWLRQQITTFAVPVFFSFMERLIAISAYFIITFYLLLDGEKYIRLFLLLFPAKYRREMTDVAISINETLGAYIRGQIILILIMSIASWIVLTSLKVNYALILCIATGILEVVPVIGPIIATTLAAIVAFYQPTVSWGLTNVTLTLIVISAYFILRQIEDLIVIPNVVGKFIHVHPVVVLFAIFIGARIGGVLGIFLALPCSAVLKVLLNYFYTKLAG